MLQNPNSQFSFIHTALKSLGHPKILLLLGIVTLVLGLMLVDKPRARAQQRPANDELQNLLRGTKRVPTIAEIPPAFVAAIKREYETSREVKREISFEAYLANRYRLVMDRIELSAGTIVWPVGRAAKMCADGTCDSPLNPSVWTGAWTGDTAGNISNANLPIATWTAGLVPNDNSISDQACGAHATQAHHSIVPSGNDPEIPSLKTVAPRPATGNVASLRLGNRCFDWGAERVSKTFVVAPGQTTLEFWYALVEQNPEDHPPSDQPGFGAFLVKSDGTLVNGLIDIDPTTPGQQNFVVADRNNPFFGFDGKGVVYRDWTCVTTDLTGYEGQTLTLVLVNRDCGFGGHWGYSYVDSFCLGCSGTPSGDASFNQAKSDCARGEICFDYTVPKLPNGTTGQATLTLELYQNGNLVNTLTSGPLPSDGTFCFTNVAAGLNPSLGGFDWRAIANFTIPGATISPKEIGKKGDGFVPGKNNDCTSPPKEFDPCCPPWNKNQLQEVLFYQGSGPISAPYTLKFQPSTSINNQLKAYVSYLNSLNPGVKSVGITFSLHDQGTGTNPATGLGPALPPGAVAKWTLNSSGIVTGPNISPSAGFFTQPLQVNRWYAVKSKITVPDGPSFVLEKCADVTIYVRVQVLANRSFRPSTPLPREPAPILEFSDGQKLLKSIPLNESTQQ